MYTNNICVVCRMSVWRRSQFKLRQWHASACMHFSQNGTIVYSFFSIFFTLCFFIRQFLNECQWQLRPKAGNFRISVFELYTFNSFYEKMSRQIYVCFYSLSLSLCEWIFFFYFFFTHCVCEEKNLSLIQIRYS